MIIKNFITMRHNIIETGGLMLVSACCSVVAYHFGRLKAASEIAKAMIEWADDGSVVPFTDSAGVTKNLKFEWMADEGN